MFSKLYIFVARRSDSQPARREGRNTPNIASPGRKNWRRSGKGEMNLPKS
jgi:hypothetical protein